MKKAISKLLSISLIIVIVTGCATTKGYKGDTLPDSEIAVITGGKNQLLINNKKQTEQILIVKVDSLEVGNYKNGWPEFIFVKEGRRTIEVRHFKPWEITNTSYLAYGCFIFGALGGAIGGAIQASTEEKENPHTHYLISFDVKKGEKYLISVKTTENKPDESKISVVRQNDGTDVPFEIIRIDIKRIASVK